MGIDTVRINGFVCSWSDVELKLDGESFHQFTDIDYGDKRTRTLLYGANKSHTPIGRTRGKYEPSVLKLSGPKFAIQAVRKFFADRSSNGRSFGDAIIPLISLQFLQNDEVSTIKFYNTTWESNAQTHAESADPLKDSVELQPEYIDYGGLTLYKFVDRKSVV